MFAKISTKKKVINLKNQGMSDNESNDITADYCG